MLNTRKIPAVTFYAVVHHNLIKFGCCYLNTFIIAAVYFFLKNTSTSFLSMRFWMIQYVNQSFAFQFTCCKKANLTLTCLVYPWVTLTINRYEKNWISIKLKIDFSFQISSQTHLLIKKKYLTFQHKNWCLCFFLQSLFYWTKMYFHYNVLEDSFAFCTVWIIKGTPISKKGWSGAVVNAMTEINCALSKSSNIIKLLRYETWIIGESGS